MHRSRMQESQGSIDSTDSKRTELKRNFCHQVAEQRKNSLVKNGQKDCTGCVYKSDLSVVQQVIKNEPARSFVISRLATKS